MYISFVDQVRVDETPQYDAVREALVNCLVNADYYQAWNVVIEKYPDRIVMENPGTIVTGRKQMLKGGISQPRNKGLFKMFNLIDLGEHAGSGVPDIYKAWRDAGLDDPVVEERMGSGAPDRTMLKLPLTSTYITSPVTGDEESDIAGDEDKKKRILAFCKKPKSKAEIQEHRTLCGSSYVPLKTLCSKIEAMRAKQYDISIRMRNLKRLS